MALFRFEIKTDSKKGGEKILSASHVEYINREGKYKNIDQKQLEGMTFENVFWGDSLAKHQPGTEIVLYTSPFGSIKMDDAGIKVSKDASKQTIAIAMLVAKGLYGRNIRFQGTDSFCERAATVAIETKIPIKWHDTIAKYLLKQKEILKNERIEFRRNGGRYIRRDIRGDEFTGFSTYGDYGDGQANAPFFNRGDGYNQSNTVGASICEKAKAGFCVSTLSGGTVDIPKRNPDVLLPDDAYHDLQRSIRKRHQSYPKLRWDVSSYTKINAESIAGTIMQKYLEKTFASSHAQYINRESRFKQRGDCVKTGHHLPTWAKSSAKRFFAMADKYESQNGERYKEIVFNLPNELELTQQEEIVQNFLNKFMQDYYYAWAIHDKIGSMSDGEKHTHVHIMFSTRQLDDYERRNERPPQLFFKRASSDASAPEKGGCKKSALWNGQGRIFWLNTLRENAAIIQNEVLQKYGYDVRVDHRSLKARRAEALANGNTFLAEILNRVPESAVGPNALLDEHSPIYREQKRLRKYNFNKNNNTIIKNILTCDIELNKIENLYKGNTESLLGITALLSDEEKDGVIGELDKINELEQQINTIALTVVTYPQVVQDACRAFMSTEEKKTWHAFNQLAIERKNWVQFKQRLIQDNLSKSIQDNLLKAVDEEILDITEKIKQQTPWIKLIFNKLNFPSTRQNIQIMAGEKLAENTFARKKLLNLLLEQQGLIADLSVNYQQQKKSEEPSSGYTAEMVADSLSNDLQTLYVQARDIRNELNTIRTKVISPQRALVIAKNNYIKRLMKRYKNVPFKDYAELRKIKRQLLKSAEPDAVALNNVQKYENIWNTLCASPRGKQQINRITAGILQKNSPIAMRFAKLQAQHKAIQNQISTLRDLRSATERAGNKNPAAHYRATGGGVLSAIAPNIAAAIAGDDKFTPLVLISKNEDMDDWELLSEAEKDEVLYKRKS